jgi:hypothetical protein
MEELVNLVSRISIRNINIGVVAYIYARPYPEYVHVPLFGMSIKELYEKYLSNFLIDSNDDTYFRETFYDENLERELMNRNLFYKSFEYYDKFLLPHYKLNDSFVIYFPQLLIKLTPGATSFKTACEITLDKKISFNLDILAYALRYLDHNENDENDVDEIIGPVCFVLDKFNTIAYDILHDKISPISSNKKIPLDQRLFDTYDSVMHDPIRVYNYDGFNDKAVLFLLIENSPLCDLNFTMYKYNKFLHSFSDKFDLSVENLKKYLDDMYKEYCKKYKIIKKKLYWNPSINQHYDIIFRY